MALLVLSATILYDCSKTTIPQSSSNSIVTTVSKPLVNVAKVGVPLESPTKSIRVYPTARGKALIKLPASVIEDAGKYVTDSSDIPSSSHRQVVTQVIDVTTGSTEAYVTTLDDPWLARDTTGSVTLDYGFKRNVTTPVARLNVRQELLQVKAIRLGVSGSVYSDGDYFVGIGAEYKW